MGMPLWRYGFYRAPAWRRKRLFPCLRAPGDVFYLPEGGKMLSLRRRYFFSERVFKGLAATLYCGRSPTKANCIKLLPFFHGLRHLLTVHARWRIYWLAAAPRIEVQSSTRAKGVNGGIARETALPSTCEYHTWVSAGIC